MCELFGYTGIERRYLNNELWEFYSHSKENPHGWGLALFSKNKIYIDKEKINASKSRHLKEILCQTICAQNAIAHIRLATIGTEETENTHPFSGIDISGRKWTLAHNGTIFESDVLNPYIHIQKGSTDSERILLYIIDRINFETERKCRQLSDKERFDVINDIVAELSPKNKLNLLIYDEKILYVHTNYKDSLYMQTDKKGISFSTKPLSSGIWKNVPFTTLTAYHNGKMIFSGTNHKIEYIPDEASIRALFLTYSGL